MAAKPEVTSQAEPVELPYRDFISRIHSFWLQWLTLLACPCLLFSWICGLNAFVHVTVFLLSIGLAKQWLCSFAKLSRHSWLRSRQKLLVRAVRNWQRREKRWWRKSFWRIGWSFWATSKYRLVNKNFAVFWRHSSWVYSGVRRNKVRVYRGGLCFVCLQRTAHCAFI